MRKRAFRCLQFWVVLLPLFASAQQSARYQAPTIDLFSARDQISQRLYALAAQNARESLSYIASGLQPEFAQDQLATAYVAAIGGLKTNDHFALERAKKLLQEISSKPLQDRLSLAIAQYYFVKGKMIEAIPYYEGAGIANLDNGEIADAKFELAYAYFNNRQFVAANSLFAIMKEVPGKYYSPGNYYYGLLAYNDGDFEAALKSFERISNEPIYRPVVPYYMAEIYYFMGQRDKALSEAFRLIKRDDKLFYDNELHLLAAQCLFEEGRYGEALPYFEYYYERTDKIRKEELYEIGYSYYRVNEWKNAISRFKPLSATQDSLGQTAMYLLGDCYLKNGEKENARSAFGLCANMRFNSGQREASLLLYAKLSYELGYSDDALHYANTLIQEYPDGKNIGAGKILLSQIYLETSDFEAAYKALSNTNTRSDDYVKLMQRGAYGYAMQEIQKQRLSEGLSLLDTSIAYNGAVAITNAALFWKAEISYRLHQYADASNYAQAFLKANELDNSAQKISAAATTEHASLTLGYASMELKDYRKAEQSFAIAKGTSSPGISGNASLREADALFMQKDFARARPIYASLANGHGPEAEYARLQTAIIAGLRGDNTEKMHLLQSIVSSNPPSEYATEARYELGVVQLAENQFNDAINTLNPLVNGRSGAGFGAKALLKIGTAQQQLSKDDPALETYIRLIHDYPNSPEHLDALSAAKSIYIARNQPEAYSKLLQDYHLPQAGDDELNSAYYNAAEAQYAAGKWQTAQQGFSKYLSLYPNGSTSVKARYYLANSYYNLKNYRAAKANYDSLLQGNWNSFSDDGVKRAAELAYADSSYEEAGKYFGMMAAHSNSSSDAVQAYSGLMRSAAHQKNEDQAAIYADSLLKQESLMPGLKDEARIYVLRRCLRQGHQAEADTLIRSLEESSNGTVAAEAHYYHVQQLLNSDKLKEAENEASSSIKKNAGSEYWLVKTYLLLGDILIKEKDYFNARATLQSIEAHTTIAELKEEARKKLEDLKSTERSKLSNE